MPYFPVTLRVTAHQLTRPAISVGLLLPGRFLADPRLTRQTGLCTTAIRTEFRSCRPPFRVRAVRLENLCFGRATPFRVSRDVHEDIPAAVERCDETEGSSSFSYGGHPGC